MIGPEVIAGGDADWFARPTVSHAGLSALLRILSVFLNSQQAFVTTATHRERRKQAQFKKYI